MQDWVLDRAAYDLAASASGLVDAIIAGLRAAPPLLSAARSRGARGVASMQAERDAVGKG